MALSDEIDRPGKFLFLGEDIETLPREQLIVIIKHLGCDLDSTRESAIHAVRMMRGSMTRFFSRSFGASLSLPRGMEIIEAPDGRHYFWHGQEITRDEAMIIYAGGTLLTVPVNDFDERLQGEDQT